MTTDRALDQQLGAWFDERSTTSAPDGLLERSLARVDTARQRPGWLVTDRWRSPRVTSRLGRQWLLAVATLAIGTGVVGASLIGGRLIAPNPSPTNPNAVTDPTVLPSPAPSETSAVVQPRVSGWTATGSMGTPRSDHTATLLPDGRVLVAGGYNGTHALATAELYDPGTGTWTTAGRMAFARGGHTATPLPDGRVLVAGCAVGLGGAVLASAELYDSSSGTWTATGNMVQPRCLAFTATLLRDGRVLVAGGLADAIQTTAEVYDPATGTWTSTGSMGSPRYDHTATLLPNGTVLVAGGADHGGGGGRYLTTAELYDPARGTWAATGNMLTPHGHTTATLLPDGKVLVTGPQDRLTGVQNELYDPSSGSWTTTGNTRYAHGPATLLPDGRVLVVGTSCGDTTDCEPPVDVTSVELYDPSSGSWAAAAGSSVTLRNHHTVTLLPDGRVLVAGGFSDRQDGAGSTLASAELYDPGSR